MAEKKDKLAEAMQTEFADAQEAVRSFLRYKHVAPGAAQVTALAGLAYFVRTQGMESADALAAHVESLAGDAETRAKLAAFAREHWASIEEYSHTAKSLEFAAVALRGADARWHLRRSQQQTLECVSRLALGLLELSPDDTLLDLGCCGGRFLARACATHDLHAAFGIESDVKALRVAQLRALFLGGAFEARSGDAMTDDLAPLGATKIFADLPRGGRVPLRAAAKYLAKLDDKVGDTIRLSPEELFIEAGLRAQENGGRTVVVGPPSLAFRTSSFRQAWTDQGRIEAVIALPRLREHGSDPLFSSYLFVFSHLNTAVHMVDATQIDLQTEDGIAAVLKASKEDTDISRTVPLAEVAEAEYNWTPNRYTNAVPLKDGIPLREAATDITRGAAGRSSEQKSATPTQCEYLQVQDLDGGSIPETLTYLDGLEEHAERTFLHAGDLVLSRTQPFKTAVAPALLTRRILVSGNLLIVRLRKDLFDPTFALMYFRSTMGQKALRRYLQGTALLTLPLSGLKNVELPRVPLAEQKALVERYQALMDKRAALAAQDAELQASIERLCEETARGTAEEGR